MPMNPWYLYESARNAPSPTPSPSPTPPPGGTPAPPWQEPTAIPGTGQPWYYPYPGPDEGPTAGFPGGYGFPPRQAMMPFFSGQPLQSSQFDPQGVIMSTDPMNKPSSWVYPYGELPQPIPVGTGQVPAGGDQSAWAGTTNDATSQTNVDWGNELIRDQAAQDIRGIADRFGTRIMKEGLWGGPGVNPNFPQFRPDTQYGPGGPQVNVSTAGPDLWNQDMGSNTFPAGGPGADYNPPDSFSTPTDLFNAGIPNDPFTDNVNTSLGPPPDTSGVGAGVNLFNAGQPPNPFNDILNPQTPPPFAGTATLPPTFWGSDPFNTSGTEAVNPNMFTEGGDFSGSGTTGDTTGGQSDQGGTDQGQAGIDFGVPRASLYDPFTGATTTGATVPDLNVPTGAGGLNAGPQQGFFDQLNQPTDWTGFRNTISNIGDTVGNVFNDLSYQPPPGTTMGETGPLNEGVIASLQYNGGINYPTGPIPQGLFSGLGNPLSPPGGISPGNLGGGGPVNVSALGGYNNAFPWYINWGNQRINYGGHSTDMPTGRMLTPAEHSWLASGGVHSGVAGPGIFSGFLPSRPAQPFTPQAGASTSRADVRSVTPGGHLPRTNPV